MNNFFNLNPDNFKKWIKSQKEEKFKIKKNEIGSFAETKIKLKRLLENMEIEQGKETKVAKEFIEYGGIIKEINESQCLIEVKSGSFYINKKYIIF